MKLNKIGLKCTITSKYIKKWFIIIKNDRLRLKLKIAYYTKSLYYATILLLDSLHGKNYLPHQYRISTQYTYR